ncbi:hypothetical protein [Citreimonas salinaria]|uniref:Uncharacterized protein n=1 Tax=Citreimonas salinaria TaxID=321339 RepID=A0A1H3G0Y1_9RHOB|nr:hypothetical protein [Citreimonas salinaria]SDX96963.1 hypothetical protein SAMN05444340_10292 [Citreimonas salinaria]
MSPPDTNTEKQAKRHKPALGGMWLGLAFVALLFIGYVVYEIVSGEEPEGAETQIQPGVDTEIVPSE